MQKKLILALSLLLLASPACLGQELREPPKEPPNIEASPAISSAQAKSFIEKTVAKVKALQQAHPKITKGIKLFNKAVVIVAPYAIPVIVGLRKG